MFIKDKVKYSELYILVLLSISYRIIIYFLFGDGHFNIQPQQQYINLIKDKFLVISNIIHTKPIGVILNDRFSIIFSELIDINYIKLRFIFISFLNIFSTILLYILIRDIFKVQKNISLISTIFYSFSLVTFEYWRFSGHFDHTNIFLITSLIFLTIYLIKRKFNLLSVILLSIDIILFSTYYTLSLVPIIVSLVFIGFNVFYKKKNTLNFFLYFFLIIIFFSSYFLLVQKNYKNLAIPYTSTVQGQNLLQFSNSNGFFTPNEIIDFINNGDYPKWYKLCANNAFSKYGDFESIVYGECIFIPNKSNRINEYDIEFLKYLKSISPLDIQKIIDKDLYNVSEYPQILKSFGVPESNLFFSAEYGKISKKLSRQILFSFPYNSLFRNLKNSIDHLIIKGSFFFEGKNYEPQLINLPYFHGLNGKLIGIIFLLSSFLSIILSILFFKGIVYFVFNKNLNIFKIRNFDLDEIKLYILLMIFSLILAISISTCCENARMFVIISPLTFISFSFLFNNLSYNEKND